MSQIKIRIRKADGSEAEIPKRNWWAWQARGAVRCDDLAVEPVYIGGGYFRMPDGSKVRGREAAGLD